MPPQNADPSLVPFTSPPPRQDNAKTATPATSNCTWVAYNAMTMDAPDHIQTHQDVPHRYSLLDRWLQCNEVGVVILQETRRKDATPFLTASYGIHPSTASNGRGGMALVFHTGRVTSAHVYYADHSTIHATVHMHSTTLYIIGGHAPHTATTTHTKSTWWNKLAADVNMYNKLNLPIIMLIDANTDPNDAINPRNNYQESHRCFQQFIDKSALTDARLTADALVGPGTHRRLDYILVPHTFHATSHRHMDDAGILTNITNHIPVAAAVTLESMSDLDTM